MHKDHVDVGIGVVEPARHRHHRRDTHPAAEVEDLRRWKIDRVEQPNRPVHRQLLTFVQGVVQPVRHPPARHPLDGDGKAVRHRRRAGNRVRAHHRLAFDFQLQGHELARLEEEQNGLVGHEAEGAHVPGFLDHLDATNDVAPIGPGLGIDGHQEGVGHAVLQGRLPTVRAAILRARCPCHIPIRDIHMLMATRPMLPSLQRRNGFGHVAHG